MAIRVTCPIILWSKACSYYVTSYDVPCLALLYIALLFKEENHLNKQEIFEEILLLLRPGQNGCHFADNIFRCVSLNEEFDILIDISLKFLST